MFHRRAHRNSILAAVAPCKARSGRPRQKPAQLINRLLQGFGRLFRSEVMMGVNWRAQGRRHNICSVSKVSEMGRIHAQKQQMITGSLVPSGARHTSQTGLVFMQSRFSRHPWALGHLRVSSGRLGHSLA